MSKPYRHPTRAEAAGATGLISLWRQRVRARRHLARLDDHLLDDIGQSRAWRDLESGKPFWQA